MRGQIIFSYALVAFATTSCAAPLGARTDDLVERTPEFDVRNFSGKVGVVEIGQAYVERRAVDAATSASPSSTKSSATKTSASVTKASASATKTSAAAGKPTPPKATTPANLPGCPAPKAAGNAPKSSGNGTEPAAPKPKPTSTATSHKKAAGTAPAPKKPSGTGTAGAGAPAPLGCDPTKPQVSTRGIVDRAAASSTPAASTATDPLAGLLGELTGGSGTGAGGVAGVLPREVNF